MIKRIILLAVMALILTAFPIMGAGAHDAVIHPALTPEEVPLGVLTAGFAAEFEIEKTVHTPEIPPEPEIYFLVDTTGSMGNVISQVQADIGLIVGGVLGSAPTAKFGLGEYKDFQSPTQSDPFAFRHRVAIGPDDGPGGVYDVSDDVQLLFAGGGGDGPEGQFYAMDQLAEAANPAGFTAGGSNIIVWIGDAPAHDPVCAAISPLGYDITEASVTAKLQTPAWGGNGISTVALSVVTAAGAFYPNALDDIPTNFGGDYLAACGAEGGASGQATRVAAATGGVHLIGVAAGDIAQAILDAVGAVMVDVSMATDCAAPINVTFEPATQTVISGDDAFFTETISVDPDAEPGVYHCDDWALIDGQPMTDPATGEVIREHKTITVAAPFCEEGVNPDGKTPQAPGTGQNEDGFYLIGAYPQEAQLDVFLEDDGTDRLFGPFLTTTSIKYTEANGAEPSIKPGPGAVDFRIKGQGDAFVLFTDDFGNVAKAACLVPPPPK